MGKRESLPEVAPRCLPVGTRVGPWRVVGFGGLGSGGLGSFGTTYRVERVGHAYRRQRGHAAGEGWSGGGEGEL